jgi:hypothetical protein
VSDGLADAPLTGYCDNAVEIFPFRVKRLEPANIRTDTAAPDFDASVTFIDGFRVFHPGKCLRTRLFKMCNYSDPRLKIHKVV